VTKIQHSTFGNETKALRSKSTGKVRLGYW